MQDVHDRTGVDVRGDLWAQPTRTSWAGRAWIGLAILIVFATVLVLGLRARAGKSSASVPELPIAPAANADAMPSPIELSSSFREVAKAVKPAVVNINVRESVSQGSGIEDFFGFGGPDLGPRRREGTGSGMIVTPDGYVLTNAHVVENADRIEVTLSDRRTLRAKIIGTDPESDIAVIKIDGNGLPTVLLGDSDALEQGDWVLALGSPFGLQQTLTAGIVSATGRELAQSQYGKYIQTDASINPGNSGGPLVNMQGQVVGINTFIVSRSGGSEGIGFAIASNVARRIFSELAKNGKITRGYLGVAVVPLDAPTARALGLEPDSGVLVRDVSGNTPAAKAGLRSGDVITSFDGTKVKAPRELTDAVAATPVGKSVNVEFFRDGQPQSETIEIAERPPNLRAANIEPERGGNEAHASRLGITAQTVTPETSERMQLKIASGAFVTSVRPGSPAAEAGIKHGDTIHRVDRTEVKRIEDLLAAEKSLKDGDEIAVQVERNGRMTFVVVTIE
ncbi:MAG TPA: trypsin-like peptidase domain-containing protein [Blastocatellia bacterium]|nr:trypsin-like peptidase domain-containing protein [Blastocatellia bacterium]